MAEQMFATLHTNRGDIRVELYPNHAPKTVANFVELAEGSREWTDPRTRQTSNARLYDGTTFHRVIPNFMIQGGGMLPNLNEKPTHKPIVLESHNGLANVKGAVAMARTGVRDSATAQFFINVQDNPFLDQGDGYAVFGHVVSGMDVVEKIKQVETTTKGPYENVPVTPVLIKKATLEK